MSDVEMKDSVIYGILLLIIGLAASIYMTYDLEIKADQLDAGIELIQEENICE